jgi:hypothetical protein
MKKAISLYCDESCHLKNNGEHVTMLGYIGVPHNKINEYKEQIKEIRKKHNLFTEVKWTKIANSKYEFYKELIIFFQSSDMIFRGLIIPTGYSGTSHLNEKQYYKMYERLLSHNTDLNYEYNIYIDIKDTHSSKRVDELKSKLNEDETFKIKNVQPIRSYESSFLQLADLILGAFTYDLNQVDCNNKKQFLIETLKVSFPDSNYEEYKKIDGSNTGLYLIAINTLK